MYLPAVQKPEYTEVHTRIQSWSSDQPDIPCTCPGLACCQVSQQHTCARGVTGNPWVNVVMLYAFICLAVGVILMASGLFLSKAISKSERSCLKAFTSHELCILFCILPFLSLTCSFPSCNVFFSPSHKIWQPGAQSRGKGKPFHHLFPTCNFFSWLVDFFFQVVFMKESARCRQWYL